MRQRSEAKCSAEMKQNSRQKNLKGFTLAEVLITLVIIGVIAAITIPIIISNYNEQVTKSALKKNYSVLKNALNMYHIENGIRLLPEDIAGDDLKGKIIKYLNVAKECRGFAVCMNYTIYKNKTGTLSGPAIRLDDGQFVLNDGTIVYIENPTPTGRPLICFSVDVNGEKGPNRFGEDLFTFQLMENGELLPMGAKGTMYSEETYCSDTSNDSYNGIGCAQKMLM